MTTFHQGWAAGCALIVLIACGLYSSVVYWRLVSTKGKGEPIDFWSIFPEFRKKEPQLAMRWMAAQIVGVLAGLYLIVFR